MDKSTKFTGTRSLISNQSLTNKQNFLKAENSWLQLEFLNKKNILKNDSENNSASSLKTEDSYVEMFSSKSSILSLNNINANNQNTWLNTKKNILDKEFNNRKLINSWDIKLTNWEEKEKSFSTSLNNSIIPEKEKNIDGITESESDKKKSDFLAEEPTKKKNEEKEGESQNHLINKDKDKEKKKVV